MTRTGASPPDSGGETERVNLIAPSAVTWIVRTLEDHGFESWTVGGAVRDALRGSASGDWDLATRARPKDVRRVFRRTVAIGVEHGTVGVLARGGVMYEVTTFRRDVATDGRHAVVSFADRIEDDLARRDFTINALAWHPLTRRLLDPFRGRRDLEDRILRTVGEPAERFREDHLRILRGFRFAGRFGLTIGPETWGAIVSAADRLRTLSAERIREELVKVLEKDPVPSVALGLYAESGALAVLYPELEALRASGEPAEATRWTLTCAVVDALPTGRPYLRLSALLADVAPAAAAALVTRMKLSNAQADRVLRLATAGDLPEEDRGDADVRRWLSRTGSSLLNPAAKLSLARARARARPSDPGDPPLDSRADQPDAYPDPDSVVRAWRRARRILRSCPPLDEAGLAIGGRDLIALGLRPGPRFGAILGDLLEYVIEDPARNRRELLLERVLQREAASDG